MRGSSEALIKEYINTKGVLDNYHSFNYKFDQNNKLQLNENIIKPYMEWDIKELHKVIDISIKEKMSHKQPDKWITFNCETCSQEREELISHYSKNEHHYCSRECASKGHMKRVKVNCDNCGHEIEVIQDKYNTNKKYFFCDQKCQHEFQKNVGFKRGGKVTTEFNCEYCGKPSKQVMNDYNKSKHHFCSKNCSANFKHKNKKPKG